jgi:hypothetical protein
MATIWKSGRAEVEALLATGRLIRVTANRELADQYLSSGALHIASAEVLTSSDPEGALQLAYDAARKSLAAILINQGLRASGEGAHVTIQEAVAAQLGHPVIVEQFGRLRRERNQNQYPTPEAKLADSDDAEDAIDLARRLLESARQAVEIMPAFVVGR